MDETQRTNADHDTQELARSPQSQQQRSPSQSPSEVSRVSKRSRSAGAKRPSRRALLFRWLIVLLVVTAALSAARYGLRFYQVTSHAQDARLPSEPRRSWNEIDDAASDGWDTEHFHMEVKKQLKTLGKLLAHPAEIDTNGVANLITNDFACGPLWPRDTSIVFEDEHLKIERGLMSPSMADRPDRLGDQRRPAEAELPYRGADGLVHALREVVRPFGGASDVRFEFKVFRVHSSPEAEATRQYFSMSGRTDLGSMEQHATWDIHWAQGPDGVLPRIRWIRVVEFEHSENRQAGGVMFSDCTQSALGSNASYQEQFLRGMNHWCERIQDPRYFAVLGNPGLAVGDVNGDGLDDLYVCQEAGLPNRLFIQQPDGTARDESASWGVDWLESSRSALLVDLDNDSDQDLVVAILGGVVMAENDGQGRFRLRNVLATMDETMSLSAVDYDVDGRLDIYVCVYGSNEVLVSSDTVALPGADAAFLVTLSKAFSRVSELFETLRSLIARQPFATWATSPTGSKGL